MAFPPKSKCISAETDIRFGGNGRKMSLLLGFIFDVDGFW